MVRAVPQGDILRGLMRARTIAVRLPWEPTHLQRGRGGDPGSDRQLQTVISSENLHLGAVPADRLELHSIGENNVDHPVVEDRIVMEQRKPFDLCCVRDRPQILRHAVFSWVSPSSRIISSRIRNFWILPVTVMGKPSTNLMWRGIL